jgi:hypothetical protein
MTRTLPGLQMHPTRSAISFFFFQKQQMVPDKIFEFSWHNFFYSKKSEA